MIEVTRLNGTTVLINSDLIETVEETPDTVISLTTGKKFIVKESRQEIKNLVILYKKECMSTGLAWLQPGERKGQLDGGAQG
mgnify:CR=1 FL=1